MKKSGTVFGKVLLTVVILLLIGAGVAGFLTSMLNRERENAVYSADLEGYESAKFAPVGDGFAAMSEVAIRVYGDSGATAGTVSRNYPDGVLIGGKTAAAAWSSGGTEFSVLKADGTGYDLSFSGGVTNADLNDEGYAVVLAGEKGYKGSVSVIRPDGEAVYRVYVGSGYPLDADVSPDSREIAILSLTAKGSRVSIYSLDREEPKNEWSSETVFFELDYLSDGRIFLLASDRAATLSGDGRSAWGYSFNDEYLKDYTIAENSAVLVLGRHQTGSVGHIVLLDQSCNVIARRETEGDVLSVSAAGKRIAIRYSDAITVYDWELDPLGSLESAAGADAAIMRSDGSAIIISGGGAAIFEP